MLTWANQEEQLVSKVHLRKAALCFVRVVPTSSISHRTTDSTSGCFTTSLTTPPSPPPIISTCEWVSVLDWSNGKGREGTKTSWILKGIQSHLLRSRVAAQWKVGNHLLIGKLIFLRALYHPIQHQDVPINLTEKQEKSTDSHFSEADRFYTDCSCYEQEAQRMSILASISRRD